jgi:phosphate/sulfate permease
MSEHKRFDDIGIDRVIKLAPIIGGIIAFVFSIGLMAAVVKNDHEAIVNTFPQLTEKDQEIETRMIRVEDAIAHLGEMRDDVKLIRKSLEKR